MKMKNFFEFIKNLPQIKGRNGGIVPLLPERKRPLLFAHRGCSSLAPENTMAAFKKARETGAPGIELDIHLCASGELVVVHDDTFQRIAGDSRAVESLDYAEIRSIDAGSFFSSAFSGEHPPLLDEVLETFCPDMYIDIELKTGKTKDDPLPGLLADTIRRFGDRVQKSVTVSSFNLFAIRTFKQRCPQIPAAVIWSGSPKVPPVLCDYLKPEHAQVGSLTRFSPPEKMPIVPWTIDDAALAEKMLQSGCQGIITNRPQDMGMLFA
jgi:glycerophosphoryl diester phosphodiesterase